MKNLLLYKFCSGKNSKWIYFGVNYIRFLTPKFIFRSKLKKTLANFSSCSDKAYIEQRVDYYNKLSISKQLPENASKLENHTLQKKKKVYFFDTYQYTRWFPLSFRWFYVPGDITFVPEQPSIVKSRPLTPNNENSVLMKLNKVRHFIFVKDSIPFAEKENLVIFRGKVNGKSSREKFMNMYYHHPMCDLGDVGKSVVPKWEKDKKTIREHLKYKFVMALEGNDVASNLKWVMSSNSIAVMPKPTCETWFMEGSLVPNVHYIEIKEDFSDLEERLTYYIEHLDDALTIIENAHRYVSQFQDKSRENLISLLVLQKYFEKTNQTQNSKA